MRSLTNMVVDRVIIPQPHKLDDGHHIGDSHTYVHWSFGAFDLLLEICFPRFGCLCLAQIVGLMGLGLFPRLF